MTDRKDVLLRAAYDLLTKHYRSSYVMDADSTIVFYDGVECDGFVLRQDIAEILEINENTDPLTLCDIK